MSRKPSAISTASPRQNADCEGEGNLGFDYSLMFVNISSPRVGQDDAGAATWVQRVSRGATQISLTANANSHSGVTLLPVVHWPAHHPHPVVRQRGDREAGDQGQGVEGGDKHLAQPFVPLIVGVLAPQRDHAVHGDGDGHVEDVRARQRADEELQRLPLLLLGADAEDAPGVGQDGHARADQPSQRVGVDDVIPHGRHLIHHVERGRGGASGAARKRRQERVHTRRRRRW